MCNPMYQLSVELKSRTTTRDFNGQILHNCTAGELSKDRQQQGQPIGCLADTSLTTNSMSLKACSQSIQPFEHATITQIIAY